MVAGTDDGTVMMQMHSVHVTNGSSHPAERTPVTFGIEGPVFTDSPEHGMSHFADPSGQIGYMKVAGEARINAFPLQVSDFASTSVTSIALNTPDVEGGFALGGHVYFGEAQGGGGCTTSKIWRYDLPGFINPEVFDLAPIANQGHDLCRLNAGLTDGTFLYFVTKYGWGDYPSRLKTYAIKFPVSGWGDVASVEYVDISSVDAGFMSMGRHIFQSDTHIYIPCMNGGASGQDLYASGFRTDGWGVYASCHLLARVDKADWSASGVQMLDVTSQYPHAEGDDYEFLRGWAGGFATGGYAYVTHDYAMVHPPTYSSDRYRQGQWVVKIDESDFQTTSVLNANDGDPPVTHIGNNDKVNFAFGLTDGTYGYVFGHGSPWMNRIHLSDFTTVDHVSAQRVGGYPEWYGGFISGDYLYGFKQGTSSTKGIYRFVADPAPTPAPTPPTPPALPSGTGDPHLQNIYGERFDLARPGTSVLVSVPRGTPADDALLVVQADARRLGAQCSDLYFQEINATGAWAEKARSGGLRFDLHGARNDKPTWVKLGPVELKVGRGHTNEGIQYLNVYFKNLGRAGFPVGGLLGSDDHTEAAAPEKGCLRTISLSKAPHDQAVHRQGSFAIGD